MAASWSADIGSNSLNQNRDKYLYYNLFLDTTRLDPRRVDEILFPSQKVVMFDLFDRHVAKRTTFYAYPNATQPLLHGDGSVVTQDHERQSGLGSTSSNPRVHAADQVPVQAAAE